MAGSASGPDPIATTETSSSSSPARDGVSRRRGDRLAGTSRAIQRALEQIAVAGRGRFAVWIQGEEGVDKDLAARLIHDASEWAQGGFFALDASIVPESLLARELFGSVQGAIPALAAAYEGAFARVRTGTVLIERIETLPKDLQQLLATVLERGEFRAVGSQSDQALGGRLIASSASSLDTLVSEGRLVAELAERLRLLEIRIPPLRERKEDILPTAAHILNFARMEIESETGKPSTVRGFTREALERVVSHSWPGNERELKEQIRAALRLARNDELGPEDLLLSWDASDDIPSFRDAKRAFEREYVTRVLRVCHGNISRAARIAKKDRKDFYDVMRRNSINPQEFRS